MAGANRHHAMVNNGKTNVMPPRLQMTADQIHVLAAYVEPVAGLERPGCRLRNEN